MNKKRTIFVEDINLRVEMGYDGDNLTISGEYAEKAESGDEVMRLPKYSALLRQVGVNSPSEWGRWVDWFLDQISIIIKPLPHPGTAWGPYAYKVGKIDF